MKTQLSKLHFYLATLLIFCFTAIAISASASEDLAQIYTSKVQKEKLIQYMNLQIQKHSNMTTAEIRKDLAERMRDARTELAARDSSQQVDWNKIDSAIWASNEELALLDKDLILAIEKAQLQQLQTSDNVVYYFTRAIYKKFCNDKTGCAPIAWIELPIFALIDTAILPVELIESILSGF